MKSNSSRWVVGVVVFVGALLFFWFGYSLTLNRMRVNQSLGFRLPEGNAEAGKVAFRELGCTNCHSVANSSDFPTPESPPELQIILGGEIYVVKTYGELVTAIIHPSEIIRPVNQELLTDGNGNSLMPDLTARMTTRQMIDLVTYLQSHYKVAVPNYPSNYYYYGPDYGMP